MMCNLNSFCYFSYCLSWAMGTSLCPLAPLATPMVTIPSFLVLVNTSNSLYIIPIPQSCTYVCMHHIFKLVCGYCSVTHRYHVIQILLTNITNFLLKKLEFHLYEEKRQWIDVANVNKYTI